MTGYLMSLSGMLNAQAAYLASMEDWQPDSMSQSIAEDTDPNHDHHALNPSLPPSAAALKAALTSFYELHGKLQGDLVFAKREIAFGKLHPKDLSDIWKFLRQIMQPITGMTSVIDTLQITYVDHWRLDNPTQKELDDHHRRLENMHYMVKSLHVPFATMSAQFHSACQHVLITLELIKPPKKKHDVESTGDQAMPGSPSFASSFRQQLDEFEQSKKHTLKTWCNDHGLDLPPDFWDPSFVPSDFVTKAGEHAREQYQRQIFMTLFLEFLLWRAGHALMDLVSNRDPDLPNALRCRNLVC